MSIKRILILFMVMLFVAGGVATLLEYLGYKPEFEGTPRTVEPIINEIAEQEPVLDEKKTFKVECEQNAENHPAKMGTILYTKGEHKFTGMKYYFKGEIIKLDIIENVGDPNIWLVKNEHGYVMPIQHYHFEAEVGDIVEIWGTLSGDGYANAEGIDNVVGQTGSMHAMQVTVNGEDQY